MTTLSENIPTSCPNDLQGVPAQLFLTLINALFVSKCPLGSKNQYPEDYGPRIREGDEFDFIVVGSGSAGAIVANKLSENPNYKVLVLEAGDFPSALSEIPGLFFKLVDSPEDWQYVTEPSPHSCLGMKQGRCKWPRGKALGGTSSINAMVHVRCTKQDFDDWAELGNDGWDWVKVKEHYDALEEKNGGQLRLLYKKSNDPIKKVLQNATHELGYPVNQFLDPENPLGFFEAHLIVDEGTRRGTAKAYLGSAKNRKNIFVAVNAFVKRIIVRESTMTAEGVEVRIGGKSVKLFAKKEVVLSAGVINTPQLLMLSGIGPKKHLEDLGIKLIKDLPVGQNLQDHNMFAGFIVKLNNKALGSKRQSLQHEELFQYFMNRTGPLSSFSNMASFFNTNNDSNFPNYQFHYIALGPSDNIVLPGYVNALGENTETAFQKLEVNRQNPVLYIFQILLKPKSRGRILLRNTDPGDKPLIYSGYFTDEKGEDLQVMLEGIRLAESLIGTKSFEGLEPELVRFNLPACDKYPYRSDDYWRCSLRHLSSTLFHPVGTCSMGPRDEAKSVVDSRLRVHGVNKLRVIDASIIPLIPRGPTNAPTMMIGLMGGNMIVEDWETRREEL